MRYLNEPECNDILVNNGLNFTCFFTDDSTDYEADDNIAQSNIQSAAKLSSCCHLCLL